MNGTDFIQTDILIIGSGLAGLRCGISALETSPDASVLIVTKGTGPVGSSFTNINNALGMQVCFTDNEKEMFVKKADAVAAPGLIDTTLTEIMAEESAACFHFLNEHKIDFNRSETGDLIRYPGCFYTETKGAVIFKNLAQAFRQLKKKYASLSGSCFENQSVVHLLNNIGKDEKTICGAVTMSEATGRVTVINARTTILAMGGTTPLFRWNVGGKSLSGYAPALLKNAGIEIINPEFHQFIWHHPETFTPIFPANLLKNGAAIQKGSEQINNIPAPVLSLIPEREAHVPAAYGFNDTEIEKYLLSYADPDCIVTFFLEDTRKIKAVLCAHAWNGGAKIDKTGWTGVPGLYTCGECAGGMHGANRIGGAMILSAQVFGRRAGSCASQTFKDFPFFDKQVCLKAAGDIINYLPEKTQMNFPEKLKMHLYQSALKILSGETKQSPDSLPKPPDNSNDIVSELLWESASVIS